MEQEQEQEQDQKQQLSVSGLEICSRAWPAERVFSEDQMKQKVMGWRERE